MQEEADNADVQGVCREASKNQNQGLAFVATDPAIEPEDFGTKMEPSHQPLGKLSSLQGPNGACRKLDYGINVKSLSTDSQSFDGSMKSGEGTSSMCINFLDNNTLAESLNDDAFKQEIADVAKDAARGSQGLDKDIKLRMCSEIAREMCDTAPRIAPGPNFKESVDIFCDIDLSGLTVDELLGTAVTDVLDHRCEEGLVIRSMLEFVDVQGACAPEQLTVTRFAEDCCRTMTNKITQTIYIHAKPPRFVDDSDNTLEPGAMDVVVSCTDDISPFELGYPKFVPGCKESVVDITAEDSEPVFNPATCETEIKRKFTIVQDGCMKEKETFIQVITLRDSYDPIYDFFPPDQTIGVFDPYGTDALGLPKAFSRCGSSPVVIDYMDTVEEGGSAAERIVRRRFTSTDVCNKRTSQDQIITIDNEGTAPLDEKGFYWLYAGEEFKVDDVFDSRRHLPERKGKRGKATEATAVHFLSEESEWSDEYGKGKGKGGNKECSVSLNACDDVDCNFDSPPPYICGTNNTNEFSEYENFLASFIAKPSLDEGTLVSSCECPIDDTNCEMTAPGTMYVWNAKKELQAQQHAFGTFNVPFLYGTQQVLSSGTCTETLRQANNNNAGLLTVVDPQADPQVLRLQGSNLVYNMFTLPASIFSSTIILQVPATSIVLLNVWNSGEIHIPHTSEGIILEEYEAGSGLVPARHILWNIPRGVDLTASGSTSYSRSSSSSKFTKGSRREVPFDFVGTMLNRRGEIELNFGSSGTGGTTSSASSKSSKGVRPMFNNTWTGQIYSSRLYAKGIDLYCSPFVGFASCDDL